MLNSDNGTSPRHNDEQYAYTDYLQRAEDACAEGDRLLGMHLYLAAFERAQHEDGTVPDEAACNGLKEAWNIACELKERSIAEYAFERMGPYLTQDEMLFCMDQLQSLALGKLEEFGLSADELNDVKHLLSDDFSILGRTPVVRVEHVTDATSLSQFKEQLSGGFPAASFKKSAQESKEDFDSVQSSSEGVAHNHLVEERESSGQVEQTAKLEALDVDMKLGEEKQTKQSAQTKSLNQDVDAPVVTRQGKDELKKAVEPVKEIKSANSYDVAASAKTTEHDDPSNSAAATQSSSSKPAQSSTPSSSVPEPKQKTSSLASGIIESLNAAAAELSFEKKDDRSSQQLGYKDLRGYDRCIETMRSFGVGMQDDEEFQALVSCLNIEHGLDGIPAVDTLLFESQAREDATRFLVATAGEMGLPVLRMAMEENFQGMTVLSVMAQADNKPQLNPTKNMFEGPGVLILENLDQWVSPMVDMTPEELSNGILLSSIPRGAREAIALIRSAVENPDVYVLVSTSGTDEIDPFFLDLLEPLTLIEIELPTPEERRAIWEEVVQGHRSLSDINIDDVVRYSENMPRHDLYMAAREAVEEAYKMSLASGSYSRVRPSNFFEKLAAYQPLDSDEYQSLEKAVIHSFSEGFEELEKQISQEKGRE